MGFDFIGRTKIWFAISGIIILVSVGALLLQGIAFGIEFTGGTLFDLKFKDNVEVVEVRESLAKIGLEKSIIQPVSEEEILIRASIDAQDRDTQEKVITTLNKDLGIKDQSVQSVGKGWGSYITQAALVALGLSIAALLIYIAIRFEFKMAVAAIIALIHDITITIGIYALLSREVTPNTIAALLTIMGYSLYDTIVVFRRVKENTSRIMRQTYAEMVNQSINQVLVRSLNTTLTTLLPVVTLLIIGGTTLKDFAFALFVGITSGTYSTIFVASPVLALWKEAEPHYRSLRKKYGKINP